MMKKTCVLGSAMLSSALLMCVVSAEETGRKLDATHGIIASMPNDFLGYFGWPTVARMEDGTILAGASNRLGHVCPYGRNVIFQSKDAGGTWSSALVINDSPLDDRDAGLTPMGGQKVMAAWFTTDPRRFPTMDRPEYAAGMRWASDEARNRFEGSWTSVSNDGGMTWGEPRRSPVSAPHGPIRLKDGSLLYFGKDFRSHETRSGGKIMAASSRDEGATWNILGEVPMPSGASLSDYHEPHVLELPDGRLIGMIRTHPKGVKEAWIAFSMAQTESADGGKTWSVAKDIGFHGSPPHLSRHSSGTLILSYGRRLKPLGQSVALSYDNGATWEHDWILRDDAPDTDLGYPSTVELPGGELLTVYYQKPSGPKDKCALLYSKWKLPKK